MALPRPINWLGRSDWTEPITWDVVRSFRDFLSAQFTDLRLPINNAKPQDSAELRNLDPEASLNYLTPFTSQFLAWGAVQFEARSPQDFLLFQTAVASDMAQWFKNHSDSLHPRWLYEANSNRKSMPDWNDKFWREQSRSARTHSFDGFVSAVLSDDFAQTIFRFMTLGGSLFGIVWQPFATLLTQLRYGKLPHAQLGDWLDARNLNYVEFFISETNDNLGFEGLGSLFG